MAEEGDGLRGGWKNGKWRIENRAFPWLPSSSGSRAAHANMTAHRDDDRAFSQLFSATVESRLKKSVTSFARQEETSRWGFGSWATLINGLSGNQPVGISQCGADVIRLKLRIVLEHVPFRFAR